MAVIVPSVSWHGSDAIQVYRECSGDVNQEELLLGGIGDALCCTSVQHMRYVRITITRGGPLTELYYDPWDFDIDLDPYPTYRRLRDECPVYYNERHNFWGVSRRSEERRGG